MSLPSTPNLVVFLTDQQRAVQYFPEAWVTANLVNLNALTANGLTFTNAAINASRCSPSRGVLATGLYAPKNGLVEVGGLLDPSWATLGKRIAATGLGYQVGYVGKWHMTPSFIQPASTVPNPPATLTGENAQLAASYGMPGWDAPDAGTALSWTPAALPSQPPTVENPYVSNSNTLGGGPGSYNQNDARIAQAAIDFLQNVDASKPFALIVSLVNPHDMWANLYDGLMLQQYPEFPAAFDALTGSDQFVLPASYSGDNLSTKPPIQTTIRNNYTQRWAQGHHVATPTMLDPADALRYLQFYAYVTYLADQQFQQVYEVLKAMPQFDDTIVVRLADHGEMGMSHGGSMEKDCNVYAETINIPYVFSNATLFPQPATCAAQAGLVDIVPTLLGLIGKPLAAGETQGTDLSALITDPTGTPPIDCAVFTYDDDYPAHIRAIQADAGAVEVGGQPTTSPYKYAVYYPLTSGGSVDTSNLHFELYVPGADGEIVNLVSSNPALQSALHTLLTNRMATIDTLGPSGGGTVTPPGWPASP